MRNAVLLVTMLGLTLSGCLSKDDDDVNPPPQPAAAAPAAPATAAAPAAADPATMLALSAFTVVDPNGIHSGTFRNTGGATWTGPDLVRGGTLVLEEVFKRDDQMVLEAIRQEPADTWDIYEVSIQAGGRVYFAYRDENNSYAQIPDHTAVDLRTE